MRVRVAQPLDLHPSQEQEVGQVGQRPAWPVSLVNRAVCLPPYVSPCRAMGYGVVWGMGYGQMSYGVI